MLSALESCPNRCMPPEKCWRRSGYRLARRPHSCIEHSLELGTIWNHLNMLKYCGISWCAADFLWALKCAKTKRTHTHKSSSGLRAQRHPRKVPLQTQPRQRMKNVSGCRFSLCLSRTRFSCTFWMSYLQICCIQSFWSNRRMSPGFVMLVLHKHVPTVQWLPKLWK
jgi:hypothetical protein